MSFVFVGELELVFGCDASFLRRLVIQFVIANNNK
jgi:hypothetical protein